MLLEWGERSWMVLVQAGKGLDCYLGFVVTYLKGDVHGKRTIRLYYYL